MNCLTILAQATNEVGGAWTPVVVLLLIGLAFAAGTLVLSILLGPRRQGSAKAATYESGMMPTGDARGRFHVRFFIMAMIFLIFDVEVVFFYPWATIFPGAASSGHELWGTSESLLMLVEILIFIAILLVAYLYAWGKGVFRWQ